ncbi:hypothetical protein GOP47_0013368 [Adiantum capillus-veneris]|uniref:Uncharacterized protein n=1 Tax=Adiantum capillus-veneris TaxID=13818 RepID=A0A9D4UNX3_ADICA|nr:hypothetical protein GOP47_0013368 [Adiantum capillus-veneris]
MVLSWLLLKMPQSSHEENQVDVSSRKSKRAPKWNQKMMDMMQTKKAKKDCTKKKSVLKNVLNESITLQNTKAFNELSNGSHEYDMNFDKDDQETILIKFLEVPTVDALYITLKASFNLAKRSTDFTGDCQEQSVEYGMRSSFVVYLLATNKVRISKCDSSPLSVDDVIVIE